MKDLSQKIAKMMGINGRIRRMDSMMIEANIRFLSRMELIYTCISKVCLYLAKERPELLAENLKPYADRTVLTGYSATSGMKFWKIRSRSDIPQQSG